ncbi:Homocysteine S-methyltransferase [Sparassis crispa]|uniref:Homocysteine S-methyltransferase n=1 Tax=Sparassis crispa TaxID=139825 RepID=A0A401GEG7_9APHY|nr:Homocysteine S-methyltransferase [Sparassis crispa]GBE80531.1 Homocysteine S-methyltransferase [Sparassis crispa]
MISENGTEILILDGGLGTTLEDVFHKNISTPLWSAKPIDDDPETIIEAHLAFLRAGADVILTSTYQCAWETFERSGYSRTDAVRIMRKSVALAVEARRRYLLDERNDGNKDTPQKHIRIALALGPYGAALPHAQEFSGLYPPPYGPKGYTPNEKNYNAFGDLDAGARSKKAAIEALTTFHLERLRVFAEDKDTWDAIDFVAFETVPLAREITAIRRAVGLLLGEVGALQMKRWWIATVYPGGHFPGELSPGGGKLTVQGVTTSAFRKNADAALLPRPIGFGVNCTSIEFLPTLLQEATDTIQTVCNDEDYRPLLVVYPNRGDVFDAVNHTWHPSDTQTQGGAWAKYLCDIVRPVMERNIWGGLIVGGCCKTGPEEIAALVRQVKSRDETN